MAIDYTQLRPRQRPVMPARRPPEPPSERYLQQLAHAEQVLAEPFRGLTSDGDVIPGLFPLQRTGVSTEPLRAAAQTFIDSLTDEQRQRVTFPVDSVEWQRWNNTHPYTLRHGLLLEDLDETQRELALGLVQAGLSARGYREARDIMRLNYTIGELTGSWEEYGEWVYFLSIMGTPSSDEPWGWQLDGHHLILNCFVLGDQVVMTPQFMGSEPVHAEEGRFAGTRVLQTEEQAGLQLVRSLSGEQRERAILFPSALYADLPPDRVFGFDGHIVAAALKDNLVLPYEGLPASDMAPGQRELLRELLEVYVGRMRPGHDRVRMEEVASQLENTYLAWIGGTGDEDVFYYRLQSPVILIEFDHQRGIAFDIDEPFKDHIHTVVRTPNGNDYGKDLLRQHYEQVQHQAGRHVQGA